MIAGRYERIEEIGRGGMGSVWRGHDTVLGRDVALKHVVAEDEVGVERAVREAQLAARLNHPQVVAVYDLVAEGDDHWLVMEHVDGTSLADRIADFGALDRAEVARLGSELARALAVAHEHGIVHRDVKPSNVLLPIDGPAKLSDFGIARGEDDDALTRTGLVTGSPAYLSPEVASGQRAVAASDVWSLGATLLHAATGQRPYDGADHLMGTLYRIVNDDPPRLPGDDALAAVVSDTMQHDTDARPTADAVADLLSAFDAGPSSLEPTRSMDAVSTVSTTATASDTSRRFDPRVLASVGAAAAVLLGVVLLTRVAGPFDVWQPVAAPSDAPSPTAAAPVAQDVPPAEELQRFAADYVTVAAADPADGFALLTPAYQEESGGIEGYRSFWTRISDPEVVAVVADADDSAVTYEYTYRIDGERRTEQVRLTLERVDGQLLIADAASQGLTTEGDDDDD